MATVTCRTEGCVNAGQPIDLDTTYVDEYGETQTVGAVICGPCGNPIEEVTQ